MIDYRENNKWTVYIHTSPSGKYYVGITSKKPNQRWGRGSGYTKNTHFYNAIQKYGWDNFDHAIIATNLTKEEACEFEKAIIKEIRNIDKLLCYNITSGGEGASYEHEDLSNMMFGFLKVLNLSEETGSHGERKWDCICTRCNSGEVTTKFENTLRNGTTISCGCYGKEFCGKNTITHGKSYDKIYRQYTDLKRKCYNEKDSNYSYFGGKGISICDEWLNSFNLFYKWSENNNYTYDSVLCLKENETEYSSSTCYWGTIKNYYKNCRNTTCKMVKYNGETHSVIEWSKISGINYGTLRTRLQRFPVEIAFTMKKNEKIKGKVI